MKNKKYKKPCIINRIFRRWTKWKIYKSNVPYIINESGNSKILMIDIYERTDKCTGKKKYKRIIKNINNI